MRRSSRPPGSDRRPGFDSVGIRRETSAGRIRPLRGRPTVVRSTSRIYPHGSRARSHGWAGCPSARSKAVLRLHLDGADVVGEVDVAHRGSGGSTATWDTSSAVWPHPGMRRFARGRPGPRRRSVHNRAVHDVPPGFTPAAAATTSSNGRGASSQSFLSANPVLVWGRVDPRQRPQPLRVGRADRQHRVEPVDE
jgi:hypothetical protein